MKLKYKFQALQKGFTLIELLIAVAIIALIASIVMLSVYQARQQSKVKATEAEARQLLTILQRQFTETGNYSGLAVNQWVPGSYSCDTIPVTGNYVNDYRSLCNSVVNRASGTASNFIWLVGDSTNTGQNFSIMVKTSPGAGTAGTWFCISGSGKLYRGAFNLSAPGCYSNP